MSLRACMDVIETEPTDLFAYLPKVRPDGRRPSNDAVKDVRKLHPTPRRKHAACRDTETVVNTSCCVEGEVAELFKMVRWRLDAHHMNPQSQSLRCYGHRDPS